MCACIDAYMLVSSQSTNQSINQMFSCNQLLQSSVMISRTEHDVIRPNSVTYLLTR